ncbi:MAG: hypothetical protein U9N86_08320 [Bacteroidota bacterium]|nr:hypothetical protein [Bacteroidota bacterium]
MREERIVYIVHCVDAEGPLYESLEATFERLYDIFGIKLEVSEENLRKLQNSEIDFGEKTDLVAEVFSPHIIEYNNSWEKIDHMLDKVLSTDFRNEMLDSFGNGWIYNWFCIDHVDFDYNPRRRDMGYHNIHDFYCGKLTQDNCLKDGQHWHFHPMSTYREAHKCATSYINSPHLFQVLCRRIIERQFFPAVYRAGFHAIRPDSNWFLEQWIPFDYSNWAFHSNKSLDSQADITKGRFGDWRLAPDDWSVYQPSHDNWQIPGNCRRWIARCIDVISRGRNLSEEEVNRAFRRASEGKPTLMSFCNHDFRDLTMEINYVRDLITMVSKKYPGVKFRFCEALDAFRSVIYGRDTDFEPVDLEVTISGDDKKRFLNVETAKGKVFGPQPFLAVKTKSGRFIHENFDFDPSLTRWTYTFDNESIRANDISEIGVATNDKYGNTFVRNIKI